MPDSLAGSKVEILALTMCYINSAAAFNCFGLEYRWVAVVAIKRRLKRRSGGPVASKSFENDLRIGIWVRCEKLRTERFKSFPQNSVYVTRVA